VVILYLSHYLVINMLQSTEQNGHKFLIIYVRAWYIEIKAQLHL